MAINSVHFKLLLKKNFMTLKRNRGYMIMIVAVPLLFMFFFSFVVQQSLQPEQESENMWVDFHYSDGVNTPEPANFAGDSNLPPFTETQFNYTVPTSVCWRPSDDKLGKDDDKKPPIVLLYAESSVTEREDVFNYIGDYISAKTFGQEYNIKTFDDYDNFISNYTKASRDDGDICWGLSIDSWDVSNSDYEISLHYSTTSVPTTNNDPYNLNQAIPNNDQLTQWSTSGFLPINTMMADIISQYEQTSGSSTPLAAFQIGYIPMRAQAYKAIDPNGAEQIVQYSGWYYMLSFLLLLFYMIGKLAEEKESKAKEGMKMMGLSDGSYLWSYFAFHMILVLVATIIIQALLIGTVLSNTNQFIFFVFNMLYGANLFAFCLMIVAFFPKKRTASQAGLLFFYITFYFSLLCSDQKSPTSLKLVLSLFQNVNMSLTFGQMVQYNLQGSGVTFDTFTTVYQNWSCAYGILMILVSLVLTLFLAYYFEQVIQSEFGVAKPWNFLFTKQFWASPQKNKVNQDESHRVLIDDDQEAIDGDPRNFEKIPESLKRQESSGECLKVRNLRKQFGEKVAVAGTNMTMYNGQIFALLGHNGAGKTTTLSMLTGLLEPNSGRAEVQGIDIFNQMDQFRQNLGICPQHDVLFEYLTVREHLELFAGFKGQTGPDIKAEVEKMIIELDMTAQADQISKTLSGGQKRKLSVGIALIGNSKIVLLDEPSSGMDTTSRRKLWEMLKTQKNGRIIILTTHYMDEADILGDRIGIMAEGKVQCCGTSLFLKNRYGVGYNLVIAKKSRDDAPQIDKFITQNIKGAIKMQEVSSEVAYQIPTSASESFKTFFQQLDSRLNNLGIESYGIGITTLEEVFLKIGHGEEEEAKRKERYSNQTDKVLNMSNDASMSTKEVMANKLDTYQCSVDGLKGGFKMFKLHFIGLTKKKLLMQLRDSKSLFVEGFFPILLIAAGLALSKLQIFFTGPSRFETPALFPTNTILYNANSAQTGSDNTMVEFAQNWLTNTDSSYYGFTFENLEPNGFQIQAAIEVIPNADQLDDYVYQYAQDNGKMFYGNYYLQNIDRTTGEYVVLVYANATQQDPTPAYGLFLSEKLLQYHTDNPNLKFKMNNSPFPESDFEKNLTNLIGGFSVVFCFGFAFMLIADALIQAIIVERQKNVKHQIMVSGGSVMSYWLSIYVGDVLFLTPAIVACLIGIEIVNLNVTQHQWLFVGFLFSSPVYIYFKSFFFAKDNSGSLFIKLTYAAAGCFGPLVIIVLEALGGTAGKVSKILKWIFYAFPVFNLNYGLLNINLQGFVSSISGLPEEDPLSLEVAGYAVYFLFGEILVYWLLIALIEQKFFVTIWRGLSGQSARQRNEQQGLNAFDMQHLDEDVVAESERVQNTTDLTNMPVKVGSLQKKFGNVTAVNNLSFGMEYGDCFALLGISGAGKTTTFKCLTGEEYPDTGVLNINGYNVLNPSEYAQARRYIGYCPQFDAIFTGLTVKEHIDIYARLKGIDDDIRDEMVMHSIKEMDLINYTNIRANQLSGGNKRKMSVAMALIGNPQIIFLDEPSTGVDPQAKRFMWNIVSRISTQRKNSAVIITTHSMEEAEALCTKMGIMVNGQFKCYGSSQHIKNKFGTGYEIEVKIRSQTEQEINTIIQEQQLEQFGMQLNQQTINQVLEKLDAADLISQISENGVGADFSVAFKNGQTIQLEEVIRWVFTETQGGNVLEKFETLFKEVKLLEHYSNSYTFRTSRDSYSIGYLFGLMEDIKEEFEISEYSVTQTTLEQIFNNFAKEAEYGTTRRSTHVRRSTQKKKKVEPQSQDLLPKDQ